VRFLVRPLGHLVFVLALLALSAAATLLGERDDLGFFAGRLVRTLWRYPEITRRGAHMVWLVWALLFGVALSSIDPLATQWDEVVLGFAALGVLCRRLVVEHRGER
jgi:hypothetical protein